MTAVTAQLRGHAAQLRGLFRDGLREGAERAAALARHGLAYRQLRRSLLHHRAMVTLLHARRFHVLETLASGALGETQLARRCGLHPAAARTLLVILEAQGAVKRRQAEWELTAFARAALLDSGPLSLGPLLELLGAFASGFDDIAEGMRTGVSPPGLDILSDESRSEAFLQAVNMWLDMAGRELLTRLELGEVRSVIAGSMGVSMSALLLERFPRASVTYGCLEHLVRRIPDLRARYGVEDRRVDGMHAHAGDPEEDRWGCESYDLVFLTKKMVLDPQRRLGERFVRKAFEVLNPGGTLLLWEAIHDDEGATSLALAMETVLDLGVSPTGALHTKGSMTALLEREGFENVRFFTCMGGETTFAAAAKPSAA